MKKIKQTEDVNGSELLKDDIVATLSGNLTAKSEHSRDPSMSARLFREYCANAGLSCIAQEILAWEHGVFSDTFSLFGRMHDAACTETKVFRNRDFQTEVGNARRIAALYRTRPALSADTELPCNDVEDEIGPAQSSTPQPEYEIIATRERIDGAESWRKAIRKYLPAPK